MGEGVGDTYGGRFHDINAVATVMGQGRADVKRAGGMRGPRGTGVGRFVGVTELPDGKEGVGVEV